MIIKARKVEKRPEEGDVRQPVLEKIGNRNRGRDLQ